MGLFKIVSFVSLTWICALPATAMNFIVQLDEAQLQRKVERMFPVTHADPLYQVELAQPRVLLREGSDRIGLRLDVAGTVAQQLSLSGRGTLEGRLRFEPESGAFYLDEAELKELDIDGMPEQYTSELRGLAQHRAREALRTRPVYVLGQSGEEKTLMGREIKAISVRQGKLIIELAMF